MQWNEFDCNEMNLLKLYTDKNDELETMQCIEDSLELLGYYLIKSCEWSGGSHTNVADNISKRQI